MRSARILIFVFFVFAMGQTAQAAIFDDILNDGINSLYGVDNPELIDNDCRYTKQTAVGIDPVPADGDLFDDYLFNTRPETATLIEHHGGTKRLDYLDKKWTRLEDTARHSMYAKVDISAINSGRDSELANNPAPSNNYFDEAVSWIKNTYHTWAVKNPFGSIRLLLLSIGLVGLIGIRRKFKKN